MFLKNINIDVFDDVLQNAKHRANDVNRPPLLSKERSPSKLVASLFHWGCCFKDGLGGNYWCIAIQLLAKRAHSHTSTMHCSALADPCTMNTTLHMPSYLTIIFHDFHQNNTKRLFAWGGLKRYLAKFCLNMQVLTRCFPTLICGKGFFAPFSKE